MRQAEEIAGKIVEECSTFEERVAFLQAWKDEMRKWDNELRTSLHERIAKLEYKLAKILEAAEKD